jgi:dTDP-4-dehydrorhamnose reductase
MILIIGASGYIGGNLYRYFLEGEAVGTYFNTKKSGLFYLNLEDPDINSLNIDLSKIRYCIICSAISNIDECKKNEEKARKINVSGTKKIIDQLFKMGIVPVFLSSDQVFDGKKGNYSELDERNPVNVYGETKKEIEDYLLNSKKEFLIIRISKIFGLEPSDGTLLTSWALNLRNNETIRSAYDQRLSPTYIGDLVEILNISLKKELRGLYNVASPESFTRDEIAKMIKSKLNLDGNIISCSIKDFNFLDKRPLNTSLNVQKVLSKTNFKFHRMDEIIEILKKL